MLKYFLLTIGGILCFSVHAQVTTDNTTFTVDQLVRTVLFQDNGCTNVTNILSSTGSGAGNNGIAYFDRNNSIFPLNDGVILSTGNALNARGPNSQEGFSDNIGTPSDADLEAAMLAAGSPVASQDVSWISFDFVPVANSISFNYLFASEEYNGSFECQFADAFAFLLTDNVTGAVTNLAIIPGTTTPVQVITVRDPPNGICTPENPGFFGQYNLGNNPFGSPNVGQPTATSPIEFNGQTVVLNASSPVVPNRSYNIKLVIGDASDGSYDSAVFIGGGSFDIGVDLGGSRTIASGNPLCSGDVFTLDGTVGTNTAATYQWFLDNVAIPGATNATYDTTNSGTYTVEVSFSATCMFEGRVTLEFVELPEAGAPDLISCDPSGVGSFDLGIVETFLLDGLNPADYTIEIFESQADAQSGTNPIPIANNYVGMNYPQTLYSVISDNTFGCSTIYPFVLILDDVATAPVQDVVGCDDDNDGITTVTLSNFDDIVAPGYTPGTVTVDYFLSQNDADTDQNPLGATFTNTTSPQTIFVRVASTNDTGCFDTTAFNIVVNLNPLADQQPSDLQLCDDLSGDEIETFDLTLVEPEITGAQNFADVVFTYYTSQTDAENDVNSITTPAAYSNLTNPETIFARIENSITGCFSVTNGFELIVNELPMINSPAVYELCDDNTPDGFVSFDLSSRDNEITGGNINFTVSYYENQNDADNRINELPTAFTNTVNPQTIIAVVEDMTTGCTSNTILDLNVIDAPVVSVAPDLELCDDNNSGDFIESFDLTVNEAAILNGQTGITFTYHNSQMDATDGVNPIANPTNYSNTSNPEQVFVRLENSTGCFNITNFQLIVNEVPVPQLEDIYFLCLGSTGAVIVTDDSPPTLDSGINPTGVTIVWDLDGVTIAGETDASLIATQIGMYTITITNPVTGCSSSQTTEVRELGTPDTFGADVVTNFFDETHRIEAFVTGPADQYIFRLDDGPWQFNGTFNDVSPGPHTVTIQDTNACGSVEIPLNVIGYPLFFTPNGDGFNDTWNIIGINDEPTTIIYIFDRYGKLLKQLDPSGFGWDGLFNGEPMPSSDYWFRVEYIEDGSARSFGGHFSLKR